MSQLNLTVELTQEELARLQQLRGDRRIDELAQDAIRAMVYTPVYEEDALDEELEDAPPPVADHQRLIAEAENDYMELDDFIAAARADFAQDVAEFRSRSHR